MLQVVLSETDYHAAAGARLRAAIDAAGLKYVEAAKIMGMSKSHLGNCMRGAPLRPYQLYRLCRVTGITADYVMLDNPSGLPSRILSQLGERELEQIQAV